MLEIHLQDISKANKKKRCQRRNCLWSLCEWMAEWVVLGYKEKVYYEQKRLENCFTAGCHVDF